MKKEIKIILDSTHDGMIVVDEAGVITLFNRAAERITGLAASSVVGRNAVDVIPDTRLQNVLSTGESELNQRQNSGSTAIITSTVPLRDNAGKIIGAAAVFRDVSEIKALADEVSGLCSTRALLEAVIDAVEDAISVSDEEGNTIIVNSAYTRITGLPRDAVLNKPVTVDIAEGDSMHLQILCTGKPVRNARMKVGLEKKEVIVNATPIFIDGKIRGSVGTIHDVSEIIALAEELENAKKLVRQLELASESASVRPLAEVVADAERAAIVRALKETSGNRARAAEMLGIALASLSCKIKKHGIEEDLT